MSAATQDILVIGPSWVGDMVMAQSLFMNLRKLKPDVTIDVVAPVWSLDLLARMPEVRETYVLDAGHGELGLRKRWRLAKRLKTRNYQRAVILPRSFKSALIPFWAGIPVRTGFNAELRYGLLNDRRKLDAALDQTVKRFVALGYEQTVIPSGTDCPLPQLAVDKENIARLFEQLRLDADKPAVALMPGAEYGPAKQWPTEYFRQLAEQLTANGFAVWILGSQKEIELGRQIASDVKRDIINLCGRTRLVDAVDLLASAAAAVSNDSGLMHVAAAVNVPLVAVYGSSSPVFTPPLKPDAIIHYLSIECSPCFDRTCRFGHYRCLKEITVPQILESVLTVAARRE